MTTPVFPPDAGDSSFATRLTGLVRPLRDPRDLWAGLRAQSHSIWNAWVVDWRRTVATPGLFTDVAAGLTVAAVALPLNVALAVACGLPPVAGLIAGVAGGAAAAIFGGAPLQVTGPAAALSFMVLGIAARFGVAGAAAAALLVGGLQWLLAFAGASRLMRFVPESLLIGFTTGVGLKLLDGQVPILLGLASPIDEIIAHGFDPRWLHDVSGTAVMSGMLVMIAMLACRAWPRLPAALMGIALATLLSLYLGWELPRVGTIPDTWPAPRLPVLGWETWLAVALAALPLGLLATAESLLSAQAVDRMRPRAKRHDGDLEVFGQGVANVASGLFGGFTVSGVIVRSSVNVQCGARTRLAALFHAACLLGAMLWASTAIGKIPQAALAGLLCVVGVRLVEGGAFVHALRHDRRAAAVFAAAALGTVTGHLMLGLTFALVIHHVRGRAPQEAASPSPSQVPSHALRAVLHSPHAAAALPSADAASALPNTAAQAPVPLRWLVKIRAHAQSAASAFIHERASLIGHVVLGEEVHIAAESSVRADEGSPFHIGTRSNIQDGAVIHALKDKWVNVDGKLWAVYIGANVSVAHQALVHGPCYVGDGTFVGFQSIVHDAVVGEKCFIGIGARIVGVDIPPRKYVPHGAVIDTPEKVAALADARDEHARFNEDVVDVNRGLAAAYRSEAALT